eukprot:m.847778 g.847778  ORF g.847778 m.847778 type:complete len:94 (-) comp23486_c0_seq5:1468-1749(-)
MKSSLARVGRSSMAEITACVVHHLLEPLDRESWYRDMYWWHVDALQSGAGAGCVQLLRFRGYRVEVLQYLGQSQPSSGATTMPGGSVCSAPLL